MFWIGLVFVVVVMVGRERLHRWVTWLPQQAMRLFGRQAPAMVSGGNAP
jgi:branched-chain amino acid transport system permease protein